VLPGSPIRPAAGLLRQFQNGAALADRDDVFDLLRVASLRSRRVRKRGVAAIDARPMRKICEDERAFALARRAEEALLARPDRPSPVHLPITACA